MITPSLVSPFIIVTAALVFIALERRFPHTPGQPLFRKQFFNDLVLYTIVQSYILSYVIALLTEGIDTLTNISRFPLLAEWPVWQVVLLSLFVHDFYIYWFHRWQHHNKYLWRIHEAHHAAEDVDWLSGSRSHSLEILINQTVEFAPLILLGAAPDAIIGKATIDAVWGMYIHSNINVRSGRVQYVINGPEMHRWHHAKEITEGGINFSTKFAFWDWMFGTAVRQGDTKPAGYGIDDPAFPGNYVAQHIYAFRRFPES